MTPLFAARLACEVCLGDSGSAQVQAAKLGVAFLLVVVVGVLASIALVARSWAKRARALELKAAGTAPLS